MLAAGSGMLESEVSWLSLNTVVLSLPENKGSQRKTPAKPQSKTIQKHADQSFQSPRTGLLFFTDIRMDFYKYFKVKIKCELFNFC